MSVACKPAEKPGDVAKSGQSIGQFSWVTGDPIGLKGLYNEIDDALFKKR